MEVTYYYIYVPLFDVYHDVGRQQQHDVVESILILSGISLSLSFSFYLGRALIPKLSS